MSIKALAWAWDYETKDALEKLVLLCVADHMNDSMGQAWPSVARICELCGCSRSTALRKLKLLEDKGIITRQKRFNKTDIIVMTYGCHSETCHTDTPNGQFEVSQRHTNPYNTLTLTTIGEKRFKQRQAKTLSEKQKAFARTLADRLWQKHKHEGFPFSMILTDVEEFLLTDQSESSWNRIGNGLPMPL